MLRRPIQILYIITIDYKAKSESFIVKSFNTKVLSIHDEALIKRRRIVLIVLTPIHNPPSVRGWQSQYFHKLDWYVVQFLIYGFIIVLSFCHLRFSFIKYDVGLLDVVFGLQIAPLP